MSHEGAAITELLELAAGGDSGASGKVFSLLHDELRRLAAAQRARIRPGDTLNTTAVVHEAFLRLVDRNDVSFHGRHHFFRTAARSMRDILVDEARRKSARKRGGDLRRVELFDIEDPPGTSPEQLIDLDDALRRMEREHPDACSTSHSPATGDLPVTPVLSPGGPPSAASSGMPAPAIEGYEIIREIGSGGMGVVYEAEQRRPRRRVALKVIRGGGFTEELRLKMFRREIETLARLDHPGIAMIHGPMARGAGRAAGGAPDPGGGVRCGQRAPRFATPVPGAARPATTGG